MIESQIIFSEEQIKVLKESVKDHDLHTTSHMEPEGKGRGYEFL